MGKRMNTRILELAEQAKEYSKEFNLQHEVFQQKFAELIVRECMDVVSRKCASPTAYNALVEHFGVEE